MRLPLPLIAAYFASMSVVTAALGQSSFPSAPLKLVVPLAPGGATDTLARVTSGAAEAILGQSVVIENRPGAGGSLAATAVIKAPRDGYTLLFANFATHTVAPRLLKAVTYDPLRDFAPVTLLASQPHVLLVNKDLGINSLAELVARAKSNPGKLNYGSSGVGSPLHLAGEYLKERAGLDLVHVSYRASGPALMDMIAGRIEIMFDNLSTGLPYVQSGQLKAIAVTSAARSPLAPDLPTMIEAGLPDFETYGWWGIAAPASTPPEIVAKISDAYRRGLMDQDVARKLSEQGFTVLGSDPQSFQTFVEKDIARWSSAIQAAAALPSKQE
jgi:tripartite-type tricarboxylate transporter receptor subunit TctC